MPENVVLVIDHGIGKEIVGSVCVRNAKKKFPDSRIIVVSGYPDVFFNNKNVFRTYSFSRTTYFYEEFIKGKDTLVLKADPYSNSDFVYRRKHLAEVWCEQMDLPFDDKMPDIFLTKKESLSAENFIKAKANGKPLMIMQIEGGVPPMQGQAQPKMHVRSLPVPIAQMIVDEFKKDYYILLIKAPTQSPLVGADAASFTLRETFSLISKADKILTIDSMTMHAAAALGKKAIVVWGGTSPLNLGYDLHNNITQVTCDDPACARPASFLFDVNESGLPFVCSYGESCMDHDADKIIETLRG